VAFAPVGEEPVFAVVVELLRQEGFNTPKPRSPTIQALNVREHLARWWSGFSVPERSGADRGRAERATSDRYMHCRRGRPAGDMEASHISRNGAACSAADRTLVGRSGKGAKPRSRALRSGPCWPCCQAASDC
jgi:hypothetical protein